MNRKIHAYEKETTWGIVTLIDRACTGVTNAQEITFYTPRTVHVVKAKDGVTERELQVVIATPEAVRA